MRDPMRDKPEHASENNQSPNSVTASGHGSVSAGRDITAPTFTGKIINSIINIQSAIPWWVGIGLLAILVFVIIIFAFELYPIVKKIVVVEAMTPNSALIEKIESRNLQISALVVNKNDLWVGSQSDTGYALYHVDTAKAAKAKLEHVLDVEAEIINLLVDCKGNIWMLLNEKGALVYEPSTHRRTTLLDKTSYPWPTKTTMFAIASRCLANGDAEIWLGREGVHTLRYSGNYPSSETMTFVPTNQDKVYQASQLLTDIRAILYVTNTETLWIANNDGKLLYISLKGVLPAKTVPTQDLLWSLTLAADNTVWVGGDKQLRQTGGNEQVIPLDSGNDKALMTTATTIVARPDGIWFGGRNCAAASSECWSLGTYRQGHVFPVDLGEYTRVRALAVDSRGVMWIGTEKGVLLYPASAP